jgi:hypothetical protein
MQEKLEYIHANPIQRKLVMHPRDWPWSSWSFYALNVQGLVKVDSMGESQLNTEKKRSEELPTLSNTERVGHPRHYPTMNCSSSILSLWFAIQKDFGENSVRHPPLLADAGIISVPVGAGLHAAGGGAMALGTLIAGAGAVCVLVQHGLR